MPWHGLRRATLALLLCGLACTTAAQPADAQRDADHIKTRFDRWIEPPLVQLSLPGLPQREAGGAMRLVVRGAHDAAVDALLALTATPSPAQRERAPAGGRASLTPDPALAGGAAAALRGYARSGQPALAEALLNAHADAVASSGSDALPRRHALALRALPAALWLAMNPNGHAPEMLAVRREALFGNHAAAQALPGMQAVWQREPDPFHAMLLLWLGGDTLDAATRQAALAVATGAADAALAAAAHAHAADGLQRQGATQAAADQLASSLQVFEQALGRGQPGVAERDRALALGRIGSLRAATGDTTGARTAWRESLAVRQRLADAAPDDRQAGLDLACAHVVLSRLPGLPGLPGDAAARHLDAAFAVTNRLAERDRFTPMVDQAAWSGMAATVAIFAGVLTLASGLLLLVLYRWRVGRWMAQAAAAPVPQTTSAAHRSARIDLVPAAAVHAAVADPRWPATTVQASAGVLFSAIATALTLALADIEFRPLRATVVFWGHGLGTVIVLWLLWAGARRARRVLLGVYVGGLVLLCLGVAATGTPPLDVAGVRVPAWAQPLLHWALAALPSLLLLLLLNRRVRSVGPVLMATMLLMCLGGAVAMVASSSYAGLRAQLWVSQQLGGIAPLAMQFGVFLAGALLCAPLAAAAARLLQRADGRGWINEQTLVADTVWLYQAQALALALPLGRDAGWALLPFAAAKTASLAGGLLLRRRAQARATTQPATRLLLLRVFGQQRRSERLFDQLQSRWAWIGPLRMIAAPDLAASTIGPGEFVDFVSGRLRRHFVIEPAELAPRLARLDAGPDLAGRYRVDEMFCGNDTWQSAVQALMQGSDLVVMDLRGFNAQRLGCRYELGALLDMVPAGRIVLVIDASTDRPLLEQTLQERAGALAASSPNLPGPATLTLLASDGERGDDDTVRRLVALAQALRPAPGRG